MVLGVGEVGDVHVGWRQAHETWTEKDILTSATSAVYPIHLHLFPFIDLLPFCFTS